MFDINNYQKTNNLAVDMVAGCLHFYRQRYAPVKAIYLKDSYFKSFLIFVIEKAGVERTMEAVKNHVLTFDDINIKHISQLDQDLALDEKFINMKKIVRRDAMTITFYRSEKSLN